MSKKNFRKLTKIKGWLTWHDYLLISTLLKAQNKNKITGDILEIGAYQGLTSILLGSHSGPNTKLYLCDIFQNESDLENQEENTSSYGVTSEKKLIKNLMIHNIENYSIISANSANLNSEIFISKMRFIHIDGSHLYEYVKKDLDLSKKLLIEEGIIALDDYRSPHTLGVTRAIWEELIVEKKLEPIFATSAKLYLGRPSSSNYIAEVKSSLDLNNIEYEVQKIGDFNILRLIDHSMDIYRNGFKKSDLLPPILSNFLNNLRRSVGK